MGVDSRRIIKALERNRWRLARVRGDHHNFKHPTNPNTVTVTHPRRDMPIGLIKNIERKSGLKLR